MEDQNERVTVGVEGLALSNSISLTALVELLEESGHQAGSTGTDQETPE